jgi:hypothetical protein
MPYELCDVLMQEGQAFIERRELPSLASGKLSQPRVGYLTWSLETFGRNVQIREVVCPEDMPLM